MAYTMLYIAELSCRETSIQATVQSWGIQGPGPQYFATGPSTITPINSVARKETDRKPASRVFRLDALAKALSVIATATWLAGWLGVCHTLVLYQNG